LYGFFVWGFCLGVLIGDYIQGFFLRVYIWGL